MTKGEAKAFEIDREIFPMNLGDNLKEVELYEETTERIVVEKEPDKINLGLRFARLKKSLRKRSVSIL